MKMKMFSKKFTKKVTAGFMALLMSSGTLSIDVAASAEVGAVKDYLEKGMGGIYPDCQFPEIIFSEDLLSQQDFSKFVHQELINTFGYEFIQNQVQAINIYNEIIDSFPTDRAGEVMYPDFFGGVYINDSGRLVTLMVEDHNVDNYTFETFANQAEITRFVNFSLNELLDAMNYIYAIALVNHDRIFSMIDSWGLDVAKNRVEVRMIDYHEESIQFFRNNILDSPVLYFIPSLGPAETLDFERVIDEYYEDT